MSRWTSLATVLLAACTTNDYVAPPGGGGSLPPPSNLFYEVTSGGPATIPVATLLGWDQVNDGSVNVWNVYSREQHDGSVPAARHHHVEQLPRPGRAGTPVLRDGRGLQRL